MKVFLLVFIFAMTNVACVRNSSYQGEDSLISFRVQGVVSGGGGKGVRCGNSVKLLDLYEGQLDGYPSINTSGDFEVDFKNYIYKLSRQLAAPGTNVDDPTYKENYLNSAHEVLSTIVDIPRGQILDFTNDATLPTLTSGCSFVQIAINVESGDIASRQIDIYRDKELWDLMSPADQVALAVHEFTYSAIRSMYGDTTSDDTRKLVAKMFSGLETYELYSPIWNVKPIIQCTFFDAQSSTAAGFSQFYVASEVENNIAGTAVYFSASGNKIFSARTRAFIPNLTPEQLLNPTKFDFKYYATNLLLNQVWSFEIKSNSSSQYHTFFFRALDPTGNGTFLQGSCSLR